MVEVQSNVHRPFYLIKIVLKSNPSNREKIFFSGRSEYFEANRIGTSSEMWSGWIWVIEEKVDIAISDPSSKHCPQCPGSAINQYLRGFGDDKEAWRSPP